ncbi:neurocalcin-delta B-like [Mercenaria mercenaria]|uniref:neurocalcin-delta B-like n=1 Tax=Mercenaria mercenaria TaxID=6596 RepID=UPI00234F02AA|nr:neurocalcin-delta B-like [Mercenaria mercenaria]
MGNAKSLISKSKLRKLCPKTLAELRTNADVDFTPEEIEEWFREYHSKLDKGRSKLTVKEFKEVYNSVFTGDPTSFVEQLFRCFDTNGDGFVDFKEFIVGLCVSASDQLDKKLEWAFKMYDIDGNGTISKEEMTSIFKAIFKMTNARDTGELGSAEEMCNNIFDTFDLNRDGQISFDEFRQGAMNDKTIVNLLECDPDPEI